MYVSGTGTLGNVQILSLAVLHSPNIKVNSAIQCLQLVLKSKNDESQAVYVYKFTPIMVRNNFHLFVKKTRGLSDFGVYHVIILAGIISYIDLNIFCVFTLDFYLSFFNIFFKHENYK